MRVKFLQQGGGFVTPTYVVSAAPATTSASAQGNTATTGQQSILSDDAYKELVTKGGLVNDTNNLVEQLMRLEKSSANPFLSSSNRSSALKLISSINELRQNKSMWEQSVKQASDLGGLGEVAVGNFGQVFTKDQSTGEIKSISLDMYKKHRDTPLLTVAELMQERQYNPQLTNQNQVFNVANNAVGLDKIKDGIMSTIHALGTEVSDTNSLRDKDWMNSQYQRAAQSIAGRQPTQKELDGLETLKQLSESPHTQTNIHTVIESQRNHLDAAVRYIWSTLGTNKQQKLSAIAAINGQDPIKLIYDMALSQTNYKTTIETTTSAPKDENAASSKSQQREMSAFELLHSGMLGRGVMAWNDPTSNKTWNLITTGKGVLTEPNGNPVGWTTLGKILSGKTGVITDSTNAYFGDKKISPNDLQNIIYDNGEAARVFMPVNSQGAPDYERLNQISSYEKVVESHPEWSPQQVNDYYKDRGLGFIQVNNNKEYVETKNFKPFLVMTGYTGEDANSVQGNAKIKALSGAEQSQVSPTLNQIWKDNKIKAPTGWTEMTTTYYKGLVAIPYRENSSALTTAITGGMTSNKVNATNAMVFEKVHQSNPNINASINSLM